jgi:hypothetical protein
MIMAVALLLAAANPVVGEWETIASTPDGDQKWNFVIAEEKGKLTGKAVGPPGEFALTDVKGDRSTLSFKLELNSVIYEVEFKVSGSKIDGTWKGGGESGTIKGAKKA